MSIFIQFNIIDNFLNIHFIRNNLLIIKINLFIHTVKKIKEYIFL